MLICSDSSTFNITLKIKIVSLPDGSAGSVKEGLEEKVAGIARQQKTCVPAHNRCPLSELLQFLNLISPNLTWSHLISPDLNLLVAFLPVNVSAPRLVKKLISKNVWVSFEPSDVGFDEGLDWITNKICKERYILEAKSYSCTNNLYQTFLQSPSTHWQTHACGWCTAAQNCCWSPDIVHQQRIFWNASASLFLKRQSFSTRSQWGPCR